jgi:glutathione synthase/RimK-type ligase-like ATP-grasp enzyme
MQRIVLLTDYQDKFSSKWAAVPYRSGMDKNRLSDCFSASGYACEFINFRDVDLRASDFKGVPVLYSSSEDAGGHYRDYIEDVLLGLDRLGALLLPGFELFRAHHNKVFMEMMRDMMPIEAAHNIRTRHFGTLEDLRAKLPELTFPCVLKQASGAGSSGVFRADSAGELIKHARAISRSVHWAYEARDLVRTIRHKGYMRESVHRNKFIVQTFIGGLSNDWKILVYGDRYYALHRSTRKNDFRASGSGLLKYQEDMPVPVLNFAREIYQYLDVPNVSLDIAYDGDHVYLIEFQCISFGTHTLDTSPFYFQPGESEWKRVNAKSEMEQVYVESVVKYLERTGGTV